ncbi:MAG: ADP-glyceromanno-heptose 6-epimerase [Bacteroidetes bacterium]|jgi:ADP-L-glycero-D-manno-heptose 6-epimerase|nr:ADP-glyceromanno-heptose 6-epimerase [Bacteroidota bacterium]
MIIVTGAAGFIGSCMISRLNESGIEDVIAVDEFETPAKLHNMEGKRIQHRVHRDDLENWFRENGKGVKWVIHIGARTDTTEFDRSIFEKLNVSYSKMIWNFCVEYNVPLVYASSAATYGLGERGYIDDHAVIPELKPLNPYGDSKNEFDIWALQQNQTPPHWYGLKFFNVYGPNEYHKGRMASVIFHAHRQITATGAMKLFRSHNPDFKDGEQLRDFIYVKDLTDVIFFLITKNPTSGIYNLGTGKARTFLDLVRATFKAMGKEEHISFIDTPEDIRDKYQYFTEADMNKLRNSGYVQPFTSLEEGVEDYVTKYLQYGKYL